MIDLFEHITRKMARTMGRSIDWDIGVPFKPSPGLHFKKDGTPDMRYKTCLQAARELFAFQKARADFISKEAKDV